MVSMQSLSSHPSQQLLTSLSTPQPGSKPLRAGLQDQKPSSELPGLPKCNSLGLAQKWQPKPPWVGPRTLHSKRHPHPLHHPPGGREQRA